MVFALPDGVGINRLTFTLTDGRGLRPVARVVCARADATPHPTSRVDGRRNLRAKPGAMAVVTQRYEHTTVVIRPSLV